jgi:hypothetical protein
MLEFIRYKSESVVMADEIQQPETTETETQEKGFMQHFGDSARGWVGKVVTAVGLGAATVTGMARADLSERRQDAEYSADTPDALRDLFDSTTPTDRGELVIPGSAVRPALYEKDIEEMIDFAQDTVTLRSVREVIHGSTMEAEEQSAPSWENKIKDEREQSQKSGRAISD